MFRLATTEVDRLKVYCVRSIVFVHEQRCPFGLEFDEWDASALHILGEEQDEPVACGRLRFAGDMAKLERIAVLPEHRGRGLARELVEFMLHLARDRGYAHFKMHAQSHLTALYARHGFEPVGEHFDEAGIDHVLMVRHDAPPNLA